MFSLQTIVSFLLLVPILFLLISRFIRYLLREGYARFNNHILDQFVQDVYDQKKRIFEKLNEIADDDRPLKVVEVAAGGGGNFKYLPKNTEVICVEPNESAKKYLLARAAKFPELKVKFHVGVGEDMSFIESESVDVVIGTHALCAVTDMDQCLAEILRILKKGGKYVFLEHILAPDGDRVQFWQYFFRPLWKILFQGCTLTRCSHDNIRKAGFSKTDIDMFACNLQSIHRFLILVKHHYAGVAVK